MAYILFSTICVFLVLSTALYFGRAYWLPTVQDRLVSLSDRLPFTLPGSNFLYSRLPSSFSGDIEAGLSSADFDLSGNVADGDSRAGLDANSKREIQKIMRSRRVDFDEARRIYTEGRFAKNNIGPDGRPRDPKFVSFS